MKRFSLNEQWLYTAGGSSKPITVPFSHLPVGHSECTRTFDLPRSAKQSFLKFDGITYYARVTLNGRYIGDMLPYSEYVFDISDTVLPVGNQLTVELEDISPAFGPTEGWENFGGIIRGVWLCTTDTPYIEDVFFKSTLDDSFCGGSFSVATRSSSSSSDYSFEIELLDGTDTVASYRQDQGEELSVALPSVKLWSLDSPFLYTLNVRLLEGERPIDTYSCSVGFRSLICDRHRFILNGKPIFLKGVCKHEMVGNSGHCPTYSQIESDMKLIKSMGCNFVRLVHYPHCKETLEIADRLGLLVCEEPGLWWSDTSNEEIARGSLEVLKRTILRDRNHPSIAFWLCFNECKFTESFLVESAKVCKRYDPTRLVSGANCMSDEDTLLYYNKCGFDFYTMHPYSPTPDRAIRSAAVLHDKPLLFTEWGGYFVYDNPHLLTDFMSEMNRLYMQNSDEGALAGAFFWFFAELNDFNRGQPACTDGILHEGLVTQDRQPTCIFDAFCQGLAMYDSEAEDIPFFLEPSDGYVGLEEKRPVALLGGDGFEKHFCEIAALEAARDCMRPRKLTVGPIIKDSSYGLGAPRLISADSPVRAELPGDAKALTLIGLTSLEGAYPLGNIAYGATMAELKITYADGSCNILPLRNGMEITTAFALNGSSRIDPIAKNTLRYATFGYDKNFEVYVANRLDLPLKSQPTSAELIASNGNHIMLYGIMI